MLVADAAERAARLIAGSRFTEILPQQIVLATREADLTI